MPKPPRARKRKDVKLLDKKPRRPLIPTPPDPFWSPPPGEEDYNFPSSEDPWGYPAVAAAPRQRVQPRPPSTPAPRQRVQPRPPSTPAPLDDDYDDDYDDLEPRPTEYIDTSMYKFFKNNQLSNNIDILYIRHGESCSNKSSIVKSLIGLDDFSKRIRTPGLTKIGINQSYVQGYKFGKSITANPEFLTSNKYIYMKLYASVLPRAQHTAIFFKIGLMKSLDDVLKISSANNSLITRCNTTIAYLINNPIEVLLYCNEDIDGKTRLLNNLDESTRFDSTRRVTKISLEEYIKNSNEIFGFDFFKSNDVVTMHYKTFDILRDDCPDRNCDDCKPLAESDVKLFSDTYSNDFQIDSLHIVFSHGQYMNKKIMPTLISPTGNKMSKEDYGENYNLKCIMTNYINNDEKNIKNSNFVKIIEGFDKKEEFEDDENGYKSIIEKLGDSFGSTASRYDLNLLYSCDVDSRTGKPSNLLLVKDDECYDETKPRFTTLGTLQMVAGIGVPIMGIGASFLPLFY